MKRLILILMFITDTVALSGGCDLVGDNLKDISRTNEESCFNFCKRNNLCLGAVFISHWNKCFLKRSIKRKVSLTMYSKLMGQTSPAQADTDSTGKDIKNVTVKSASLCDKACRANEKCTSFTFIDAYQSCWLKSAEAKLVSKKFSCFVK